MLHTTKLTLITLITVLLICSRALPLDDVYFRLIEQQRMLNGHILHTYNESVLLDGELRMEDSKALRAKFMPLFMEEGKTLKVHFTGDSVLASHDNYFNQSYAHVFEHHMKRVLHSIGGFISVKNLGVGDNPCVPYDMCVSTIAGQDADIIVWDQGMEGYNTCVELFMRSCAVLDSQPAVLFLDSSPIPNLSQKVIHKYRLLFRYTNEEGRGDLMKDYAPFGIHSLQIPERLRGVDNPWLSKQRLMHEDKAIGAKDWHPGPHGHELTGVLLARHYVDFMVKVIGEYKRDLASKLDAVWYPAERPELFPPRFYHVEFTENPRVHCATTYEPKVDESMDLVNFVASGINVINDTERLLNPETPENEFYIEEGEWRLSLLTSKTILGTRRGLQSGAGYADRKWLIVGYNTSSILEFEFPTTAEGHLYLCTPHLKHRGNIGSLLEDVDFFINGIRVEEKIIYHDCVASSELLPAGTYRVRVSPLNEKRIALSYAFWW